MKMTSEVPQEMPDLSRHVKVAAMCGERLVELLETLLEEVGLIPYRYIWCA